MNRVLLLLTVFCGLTAADSETELEPGETGITKCNSSIGNIHEFMVETLDGKNVSMSKYKGSVVLLLNVATF